MSDFMKSIPITPDMVSLWVPSGLNRAQDLIRGNHGQCYGTHPNVPTIAPPIDQIHACDATTDWSGTAISLDNSDKMEGTGCLVNTVASPVAGSSYYLTYNFLPTGLRNWSDKKDALFWFKCDRASTAFTSAHIGILDESNNYRIWYMTFSAGAWTSFRSLLSTGGAESPTPPDLTSVKCIQFKFVTADTTAFYQKLDDIRVTGIPSLINTAVGWRFGGDDYVGVPDDDSLDMTDKITGGCWLNLDNVDAITNRFLTHMIDRTEESAFEFFCYGKAMALYLNNQDVAASFSSSVLTPKDWQLIGFTYDKSLASGNIKLFRNAVRRNQHDYSESLLNSSGSLRIGGSTGGWTYGYQALNFLAKSAWSVAQWENFYNASKGFFAPRS